MNTFKVTESITEENIELIANILENGSINHHISIQHQTIMVETYNLSIAKGMLQRVGFEVYDD